MTLSKVLRDAKLPYVPHGFRSSFRDWAGEQTSYPSDVCEAALAHVVRNPVERAYHRTRYYDRRIGLMNDWADYLNGDTGHSESEDKALEHLPEPAGH